MENQLTTQDLFKQKSIQERFEKLLGKKAQGFITSVLQTVNSNGLLQTADPQTVLNASATAAALDLPINNSLGYAYIIPYNTKQADGSYKTVAQFQLGYKGFIQLAQRSGQFVRINASDVREGEIDNRDRLSGDISFNWIEDETERNAKPVIGYVSYFRLSNGFESTLFMSVDEMSQHGTKYSKTFKKGLWQTDFDTMAKKTVIKLNLSKNAPLSIEMQNAIQSDQSVQSEEGKFQYVDNDNTIDVEVIEKEEEERRVGIFIEKATTKKELEDLEPFASESQLKEIEAKKKTLKA